MTTAKCSTSQGFRHEFSIRKRQKDNCSYLQTQRLHEKLQSCELQVNISENQRQADQARLDVQLLLLLQEVEGEKQGSARERESDTKYDKEAFGVSSSSSSFCRSLESRNDEAVLVQREALSSQAQR